MTDKPQWTVGQEVAYTINYGRTWRITRITRITPSGRLIVEGVSRQFDAQGRQMGSRWERLYLEPVTDEIRDAVRRDALLDRIQGRVRQGLKGLSTDQLERIVAILDEATP